MLSRLPFLVFAVTAAIGLVMPVAAYRSGAAANYLRFERFADEAVDRISVRIMQHISLLLATRSLFEAQNGNVSYRQFASFIRHLNIEERYGGIQGIGYAAVLRDGEEDVRSALKRNYAIDRMPFPQSDQGLRTAIVMLEPVSERNRAALGFDMYSEAVRRDAMNAAITTGEPKASGTVELMQEIGPDKQAGFLIYVPLFARDEAAAAAGGDPFAEIRGFVYAPFRTADLIRAALNRGSWLPVHLEIRDASDDTDSLIFESANKVGRLGSNLTVQRDIDIAGRRWNFEIRPGADFRQGRETGVALTLGAVSLLLAAALAMSMRSQLKSLAASREVLRVTEQAASEKDFLLQEMKHRIKNSIARVLAIARHTAKHAKTLEEFTESFTNRLQAMANSQDLLARSHGETADLEQLLAGELQQVFGDRIHGATICGPQCQLGVRSTQALALVFHELATNALKYAAIDEPGSSLEIRWSNRQCGSGLVLDWREYSAGLAGEDLFNTNGGFGTRLIQSLVEGELSGSIDRKMTDDGMFVRIEIPDAMV